MRKKIQNTRYWIQMNDVDKSDKLIVIWRLVNKAHNSLVETIEKKHTHTHTQTNIESSHRDILWR